VLVLGHGAKAIQAQMDLAGVVQVHNPNFRAGQSTSLKAGLAQLPVSCQGALVLLGDQPRITPALIETLLGSFNPQKDRLVIPTCQGRRGNPVLIHQALFPLIAKLEGDVGARALFARFSEQTNWVAVDDCGIFQDVDTPADYARLTGWQHQRGAPAGRGKRKPFTSPA
jgi:molybdenum cofactor cytidylyltransferase